MEIKEQFVELKISRFSNKNDQFTGKEQKMKCLSFSLYVGLSKILEYLQIQILK